MYQCQMGKQTMGTPGTALKYRTDNKSYKLQTGQTPVVRPPLHNEYGLDNFPNGTNAVVAVISYTGYDMDEDVVQLHTCSASRLAASSRHNGGLP
jgi:DNA-directed RNA polymerase I subunit RPA2